jgi:hypothetical protein
MGLPDETPIVNVRFSTRIANALNGVGVKTVGEIREASDATLLSLQDLGKGSLSYLRKTLSLPTQPGEAKPPERQAEGEGEMSMKVAIGILALFFATSAFAQIAPPNAGKKPHALAKPQTPMACKLVGTVKGTKIWAGDCVDAAELRGGAPSSEVEPPSLPAAAGAAIPPGQKQ